MVVGGFRSFHVLVTTTNDLNILGRLAENNIYISDSLTEKNKKLFKSALKWKKDFKYQFIWSIYGKVYLRKNVSSPAVHVSSEQVLVRLAKQQASSFSTAR